MLKDSDGDDNDDEEEEEEEVGDDDHQGVEQTVDDVEGIEETVGSVSGLTDDSSDEDYSVKISKKAVKGVTTSSISQTVKRLRRN